MRTHMNRVQPSSPIREPISPENSWARRASTRRASPPARARLRRRKARRKKIGASRSSSCRKVLPTKLIICRGRRFFWRRRFTLHSGPSLKWEGPFLFSVPLDGLEKDLNEKTEKHTQTSRSHFG